ncbi:MAG: baseplate J/gp47 family protein [Candidatus Heimdallarchaeota archaeon]
MSEFGFTSGGFIARTPQDIELDYQDTASGVYEEINYGPGSPLYQLGKVIKIREYQMELFLRAIVSGLSVLTAYGAFLDALGESKGVLRNGPLYAGGFTNLMFPPPDVGSTYNIQGITYYTNTNLAFERAVSGARVISRAIPIVRGSAMTDPLPQPYINISGIGYIDSASDGSGLYDYNPSFNTAYQYFDWNDNTGANATTGMIYYVEVTEQVKIKDEINATYRGTTHNVGANTIVRWSNPISLSSSASVNNPYSITGGSNWESDNDYRSRLIRVPPRNFTLGAIRAIAEDIDGVRSAHVYQAKGLDKTSVSGDWDVTTPDYISGVQITGIYSGAHDIVSGGLWSQRFSSSHGIITLKNTVFRGYRVGFPPPLVVGLRNVTQQSYLNSGIFDTFSVTPPASNIQDLVVYMGYMDLDYTKTYALEFWCRDKTGAVGSEYWDSNYWVLITGSMSGSLGNGDSYTGLLIDPTGLSHESNTLFKTEYGAAAFKIDVAIKDGYGYQEIAGFIDEKLDWVEGSGFAPVGVDYAIREATQINIFVTATLYIRKTTISTFSAIGDRIAGKIEQYIESLQPGENVIYSEIYRIIMDDSDTWRLDELEIFEQGGTHLEDEDVYIKEEEVAIFGGKTFNQG